MYLDLLGFEKYDFSFVTIKVLIKYWEQYFSMHILQNGTCKNDHYFTDLEDINCVNEHKMKRLSFLSFSAPEM